MVAEQTSTDGDNAGPQWVKQTGEMRSTPCGICHRQWPLTRMDRFVRPKVDVWVCPQCLPDFEIKQIRKAKLIGLAGLALVIGVALFCWRLTH